MNKGPIHIFLLLILLFASEVLCAQQHFTISGYVKDKETGEDLIGASIYSEKYNKGILSNEYGFYSITFPKDSITLIYSYFGYLSIEKKIYLDKNIQLNIYLESEVKEMEEIVIETDPHKEQLESTQMSTVKITPKEAKLIPAFFGEVDLLKTLQLKPGVQSGGEGAAGLYVRGGGPDQNLILLDEAPVYNASHLFGFFSVFNPDAVKDVELYKGGFPSQFGGRLSSVVDIRMNEGNKNKFSGSGGIGLIASRLTLEAPIKKDKSSFIISGRRTYFDIITRQINRLNKDKADYNPIPDYYFYDLNAKVNFNLGEKDRLFLSGYFGKDIFGFNSDNFDFNFKWGNSTSTLRWNHLYSSKLFSNISFIFSDYYYNIENKISSFSFSLGSKIRDYNLKGDFDYYLNDKHHLKFGFQSIYHKFVVGRIKAGSDDGKVLFNSGEDLNATELAVYISDDYTINPRWRINTGLRYSTFLNDNKFFNGIEPRASVRYILTEKISLKTSYARMFQYIHLVSNSGASLPTDIWYPSTKVVQPQRSDQIASGISIAMFGNKFLLTDEVYYKWMKRQIDFKDGAQLFANPNLTDEFLFGKGWAYGNEIYFEKKKGKTTGWVGYTLSWTWKKFEGINQGNKFPARYDRRHDISLVVMHKLSERVHITGTWVYGTGNAISLAVGRFYLQDYFPASSIVVPEYLDRNSFRMPSYHRLDLGLVWKFKPKWGESDLTFNVINAYNRRNAYFIYYEEVKDAN
ncbi:MAG: TonB-dependent receptor, partial [Cytophagaceae bacterium]|nr:TonB-dependent receptor [Cytophagaceae bacterium]